MNERKTPIPEPTYMSVPCSLCGFPMGCPPGPEFKRICYGCLMSIQWELRCMHPGANGVVVIE